MTYHCYHRWFTDVGMYAYIEKDGRLHSIAPLIVRAGHGRYERWVEPKKA